MPTELNIARYKNTVCAIAWVQLGLFILYLPIILDYFSQIQVSHDVNLLKLISEPLSLLLENRGGETSCKGHN